VFVQMRCLKANMIFCCYVVFFGKSGTHKIMLALSRVPTALW